MPKPNPLLESDNIECAHKGKVLLQSSTKDIMCVQDSSGNDAGMISLQDLANATIIGCTNNIAGVPSPCTKLVNIPNSICSTLLEIDNQKIIIAQAISQILTDKGSPLILQGQPKAKDIFELDEDIADFDNTQNGNENAESMSESSAESSENLDTKSNEIFTPLPQRYASNDDMAFRDLIKRQEWEKFKKYYLNIHKVNNTEIKEAKERIGEDKLQEWKIMFGDNIDIFIRLKTT